MLGEANALLILFGLLLVVIAFAFAFGAIHAAGQRFLLNWLARHGPVEITCHMGFAIRFEDQFPEFKIGPPGQELAYYVPDDVRWRQLNYGQAEGQVDIDGREWGFYENPRDNEIHVALHSGEVDPMDALTFVRAVAAKVAHGECGFQIHLKGDARVHRGFSRRGGRR